MVFARVGMGRQQTEVNLMEANNQFSDSAGTELLDLASDHLITSTQVWLEASDVMNKDVATMPPDGTAVKAAEMMAERSISSIIIVDAGSIAGIITETDLLRRVAAKGYEFERDDGKRDNVLAGGGNTS